MDADPTGADQVDAEPRGGRPPETARSAAAGPWLWAAVLVWTAVWAWWRRSPSGISWHFFPEGARLLLHSDGLHLYARHPELQIGPLTLLVVSPLTALPSAQARTGAQLLMTAALPIALWLMAPLLALDTPAGVSGGPRLRLAVAAGVLAPAWSVLSVRWAHPDDVLAILFAVAAVRCVAHGRAAAAGLLLASAVAAKPWALGFLPILAALGFRAAVRAVAVAVAGTAAAWLPFVAADGGTVAALSPPVAVADSSVLRLLGYSGSLVPRWTRTAQLVGAPLVAMGPVAAWRARRARPDRPAGATRSRAGGRTPGGRRWVGALVVAVAVRLALDPQDLQYYAGSAVLAAAVFDLLATRWLVPWTTLVTALVLWQPFVSDFSRRFELATGPALWWFRHPGAVAAIHLGWAVAVVALVLLLPEPPRPVGAEPETL